MLVSLGEIDRGSSSVLLLFNIEANFLALTQAPHPRLLDRADVDEDVLATRIRRDEPVPFGRIKPLHGATRHRLPAFLRFPGPVA